MTVPAHAMSGCDRKLKNLLLWVLLQHLLEFSIHGTEVFHLEAVVVEVFVQQKASVRSFVVYSHEANSLESLRLILILLWDVWIGLLDNAFDVLRENTVIIFLEDEEGSHVVWRLRYPVTPSIQMWVIHW